MELIYLWFNNYKGLNNLGLVLNAAYEESEINYSPKTQNVKINIREKQNYINIFSENLNIITLVGKNGSGKSSIVSVLNKIIHSIKPISTSFASNIYDDTLLPDEFCLICKQENSYIAYCSNERSFSLTIQTKSGNKLNAEYSDQYKDINRNLTFEKRMIKQSKNEKISSAMFQPFLRKESDYLDNFSSNYDIYGIAKIKLDNYFYYDRFRLYDTVRTIQELYKFNDSLSENKLELFNENNYLYFDKYSPFLNIYKALHWVNNRVQSLKKGDDYPIAQTISNSIRKYSSIILSRPKLYTNLDKVISDILPKLFFAYAIGELLNARNNPRKTGMLFETDYHKILNTLPQETYLEKEKRIEFYERILKLDIRTRIRDVLTAYLEYEKNESRLSNSLSMKDMLYKYYEVICDETTYNFPVLRLKKMATFTTIKKYPSYITQIERLKGISKNLYKVSSDKKLYDFLSLSTGEQRLLKFMADVYFVANMKELKRQSKNPENNIYIFDEMDLSWHPEWQRNMVLYIVDLFNKVTANNKNRKINLIFTTHSPMILSDMPKTNVIFLPKISTPKDFDTFGANIHDLFKTGLFFDCKNCNTLGAFAKKEILKILNTLNSDNLTSDESEELKYKIEMIGEPIIRNSLMDKLYLKCNLLTDTDDYTKLKTQNLALKKKLMEYRKKYEKN